MNKLKNEPQIIFQRLNHAKELALPSYESSQAAGMDLRAALDQPETLLPGKRMLIPTGFKIALPQGFEAQIRPRSGLAYRNGITMLNSPGTVDSDYRGEIKVLAVNLGDQPFIIRHGDRIAQMVISPVTRLALTESDELDRTMRGDRGFGSTGV
ncbi:MAG: dUTP diphosphatase [Balneolaceae bacterium]